jgi:hypothetical protein
VRALHKRRQRLADSAGLKRAEQVAEDLNSGISNQGLLTKYENLDDVLNGRELEAISHSDPTYGENWQDIEQLSLKERVAFLAEWHTKDDGTGVYRKSENYDAVDAPYLPSFVEVLQGTENPTNVFIKTDDENGTCKREPHYPGLGGSAPMVDRYHRTASMQSKLQNTLLGNCQRPLKIPVNAEWVFKRCGSRDPLQCGHCSSVNRTNVMTQMESGTLSEFSFVDPLGVEYIDIKTDAENYEFYFMTFTQPSFGAVHANGGWHCPCCCTCDSKTRIKSMAKIRKVKQNLKTRHQPNKAKRARREFNTAFNSFVRKHLKEIGCKRCPEVVKDATTAGVPLHVTEVLKKRDASPEHFYNFRKQAYFNHNLQDLWDATRSSLSYYLPEMKYAMAVEFQQRLAAHIHVIVRLPKNEYSEDAVKHAFDQAKQTKSSRAAQGYIYEWGPDYGQDMRKLRVDNKDENNKRTLAYAIKTLSDYTLKSTAVSEDISVNKVKEQGLGLPRASFLLMYNHVLKHYLRCNKLGGCLGALCDHSSHEGKHYGYTGQIIRFSRNWSVAYVIDARGRKQFINMTKEYILKKKFEYVQHMIATNPEYAAQAKKKQKILELNHNILIRNADTYMQEYQKAEALLSRGYLTNPLADAMQEDNYMITSDTFKKATSTSRTVDPAEPSVYGLHGTRFARMDKDQEEVWDARREAAEKLREDADGSLQGLSPKEANHKIGHKLKKITREMVNNPHPDLLSMERQESISELTVEEFEAKKKKLKSEHGETVNIWQPLSQLESPAEDADDWVDELIADLHDYLNLN